MIVQNTSSEKCPIYCKYHRPKWAGTYQKQNIVHNWNLQTLQNLQKNVGKQWGLPHSLVDQE